MSLNHLGHLIAAVMNAAASRLSLPPVPAPGAYKFLGQHTNPERNNQRKACENLGRRQYIKLRKDARKFTRAADRRALAAHNETFKSI